MGLQAEINVIELDAASELSIMRAEERVRKTHGRLDILANNARIAIAEKADHSNLSRRYAETLNTNVTGITVMISIFMPLMKSATQNLRLFTFRRLVPY